MLLWINLIVDHSPIKQLISSSIFCILKIFDHGILIAHIFLQYLISSTISFVQIVRTVFFNELKVSSQFIFDGFFVLSDGFVEFLQGLLYISFRLFKLPSNFLSFSSDLLFSFRFHKLLLFLPLCLLSEFVWNRHYSALFGANIWFIK